MDSVYSKNRRIFIGMQRSDISKIVEDSAGKKSELEKKHLQAQLTKAFETADGIVNIKDKNDKISEEEVIAYDKKMRNRKFIIGSISALICAWGIMALVRNRNSVLTFRQEVNKNKTHGILSPEEFNELISKGYIFPKL